jgi:hypothetical protein
MVYFLQDWIVNPMLILLKRTMSYPGFEPGTFGVAVSIPTHCTLWEYENLFSSLLNYPIGAFLMLLKHFPTNLTCQIKINSRFGINKKKKYILNTNFVD